MQVPADEVEVPSVATAEHRPNESASPTRAEKVGPLSIAAILAAAAVYIFLDSLTYKPGVGGDPGAAALPKLIALLSLAAAAALAVQTLRFHGPSGTTSDISSARATGRVAMMAVIICLAIVLLPLIGFFVSMTALLYVTGIVTGAKRWWVNLLIAVTASWVTLLLFSGLFAVPLPRGPLDILIGG